MHFSTTLLAAIFASANLALAAPAIESRQFEAQITFSGASGAEYSLSVPTLAEGFTIDNPLSVSKITSLGGASCTFFGSEGSVTTIVGARSADVGPPQPQVSGSCLKF